MSLFPSLIPRKAESAPEKNGTTARWIFRRERSSPRAGFSRLVSRFDDTMRLPLRRTLHSVVAAGAHVNRMLTTVI